MFKKKSLLTLLYSFNTKYIKTIDNLIFFSPLYLNMCTKKLLVEKIKPLKKRYLILLVYKITHNEFRFNLISNILINY